MLAKDIERVFYKEPFAPFRVVLNDGEEILVNRCRKAIVSGPEIAVAGISRRNGGVGRERLRIVPVEKVAALEFVAE